ncbi:p53-like transcription factor [Aspergillus uvarum CBS 121591]|uniref:p53-like transcription factor n=1 Tax=Aspergillus uvarum CBS 121591 TaxID=1448315 RepID=A0A319C4I5_9EURO|nr:p53-like transcription factor [Aspergillus uvarum CBS 121591]PYH80115.1 p53-like transcription factor [Aspergillus uvarum CBS 121591]
MSHRTIGFNLSKHAEHNSIRSAHPEASSPKLTSQSPESTLCDPTDTTNPAKDTSHNHVQTSIEEDRTSSKNLHESSPSLGSPHSPVPPEYRSVTSSHMGMDSRHLDIEPIPCPRFTEPEIYYRVTAGNKDVVQPRLDASFPKGFFQDNKGRWTGYRRNYFSVSCVVYVPTAIYDGLSIQPDGAEAKRIQGFSVTISAIRHGKDGEVAQELIQQTPRRHKPSERRPQRIPLFPFIQATTDRKRAGQSDHTSIPGSNTVQSNKKGEARPVCHTFERVQFQKATPNSGKRRGEQQYYNLVVELHVQIPSGENARGLQWLRIARRTSEPLIIRGRVPGHYKDVRKDMPAPMDDSSGFR